ncbi:MAG: nitroreductase family protein, partial [Clostridiales bacterium]|nr:nitroreductase family protein [Clostridiales bacterium]
ICMGIKVSVNEEKCVGCSSCVKDCPAKVLYIENSKAKVKDGACIDCGHCFAVCPSNAVSMKNYNCEDCHAVTSMAELDSETLLNAMKSRRTIRQYKDKEVEPEKIEKILEAGRYSPTGANSQNVAYTILGSKQNDLEKECVKMFRTGVGLGGIFSSDLKGFFVDDNFFFKKAPLVIVVSGKDEVNASLASAYMEIMAESLGLGVLYSGFFVGCSRINPKIKSMLELPKGHKAVTCMIIGYPDVKYQRIAPRKPLKLKKL